MCEPSTEPLIFCDTRCDHHADLSLTSAEVAAGRTSVRVMARGLGPELGLASPDRAKNAGPEVHFFLNRAGISADSIWLTVEKPILDARGVTIITHLID